MHLNHPPHALCTEKPPGQAGSAGHAAASTDVVRLEAKESMCIFEMTVVEEGVYAFIIGHARSRARIWRQNASPRVQTTRFTLPQEFVHTGCSGPRKQSQ